MKSKQDIAGYKTDCFYYEPCPLCYGCRNYHKYCYYRCDERCARTEAEKKFNVCTKPEIHNPKNFEKMLSRPEPICI